MSLAETFARLDGQTEAQDIIATLARLGMDVDLQYAVNVCTGERLERTGRAALQDVTVINNGAPKYPRVAIALAERTTS